MPRPASLVRRVRFAGFELDERAGELRRDGELIHLTPQVWRVLSLLVSRAGELVLREELREALWQTGTLVDFEIGLNHCMNRLRAELGDSPEAPRFILTVPRRGYRFIAKVDVVGVPSGWALAVLPFQNLDREGGSESLSDALTGAVITELARAFNPRVLSRQSVLHLKGSDRSLREICSELGVEAVVEGATSFCGDAVHVMVGLVQVEPEGHLWAGRFEGRRCDPLDLERRVAEGTAAGIRAALGLPESDGPA